MGLSNRIIGVVMALFVLGAIGGTALIMATNSSAMTTAGVPSEVIVLWTVAVPIIAGVAVMMYFIPNRAMAFVPQLSAVVVLLRLAFWLSAVRVRAKGFITRLLHKFGRD